MWCFVVYERLTERWTMYCGAMKRIGIVTVQEVHVPVRTGRYAILSGRWVYQGTV